MMRFTLLLALTAAAWAQQAPPAASADPVVLTVGTQKLTKSQFEQVVNSLSPQQQAQVKTPEGRRKLAEQLSELLTLAEHARAEKLDQNPVVQTRLMLQTDQVLASAAYQALGDVAPDDAAMQKFYDDHKQDWEEVKARHILIRFKGSQVPLKLGEKDLTDQEALQKAKDLRAKIVAGANFADLAKTESDDAGSAVNGGDLGSFTKDRMVPEFANAAFAAKIGEVTEPVKSAYGYHLILVESHSTKSFAEAKPEIEKAMGPEMAKQGLEALKKKTTVVYDESYFGK
jgi:parvulin-like peptidyl-prolyl isomerase